MAGRIGSKRSQDPAADPARWEQWRAQRLRSAGFPSDLAQWLARGDQVDLHELLELVDRGCSPPLAARILAPLDSHPGR